MLNGGSSGLTPPPSGHVYCGLIYIPSGFFFLVVGWFVGFLVFFKPWYRGGCRCTFRPAADHEAELPVCPQQRGGGGGCWGWGGKNSRQTFDYCECNGNSWGQPPVTCTVVSNNHNQSHVVLFSLPPSLSSFRFVETLHVLPWVFLFSLPNSLVVH